LAVQDAKVNKKAESAKLSAGIFETVVSNIRNGQAPYVPIYCPIKKMAPVDHSLMK
jgi:hypothetical protein